MHLILLVGTNPIPNYVVAMYAAKNGASHYYLVHTLESGAQQATQDIAEALRRQLIKRRIELNKITLVPLQDASNSKTIHSDLKTVLCTIPANEGIILNYTGGTKAMAIHSYTWLKENRPDQSKVFFQYLDARSHSIVTDWGRIPETEDMRNDPNVSMDTINTMLELHGYELLSIGTDDPHPTIALMLGKLIENDQIETFFEMKRLLRMIYYDVKGICTTKNRLMNQLKDPTAQAAKAELEELLKSKGFLKDILNSFPHENRILNEDGTLWTPTESSSNNDVARRTKGCIHDYLDGKWLEFHVLRAMKDIVFSKGLTAGKHFGHSMKAYKAIGSKDFELDLFVLRGYQLTGISVTTAGLSEAKSKAFEVMHRARQIGGEEARGILVANLWEDKVAEMEKDITFLLTGSTSDYFKVIGREDWGFDRLKTKLEETLWS